MNQLTQSSNTPEILTPNTGDIVIASNPNRIAFSIQNLGINPLFILLGSGATTSIFHTVLKGGTGNDDGTGGSYSMEAGAIYTGAVSIAGTSPRLVITQLAP